VDADSSLAKVDVAQITVRAVHPYMIASISRIARILGAGIFIVA
jgi:hypothetical protein